jgi:Carboxypeptidase regulatory-like domain
MGHVDSRNSSYRKVSHFLGFVFAILFFCVPAFSQGTNGRILGIVTDQTGGVVSGATVTVVDTARGITRTLTTDEAGEYNAPNLTPGTYTVLAEAKGFKKLERQNIVIEVGKEVRVDLTVQPGEQEQTVTVTEAAPLVETTNATLGGTINNADINDMPLNGRNYQNLMSLRPGVVLQPGGGPWTQSTNNIRPDESVWMLEGIINVEWYDTRPLSNTPSFITDGATILPVDAIQEFNMEENPKAEYGWKPGAVVNVGLKSGTNSYHGSTYGFYRSSNFDARNIFDPTVASAPVTCAPQNTPAACAKTPVQLKQFGGVVGGPIKKDKLFFFAGYEGLRDLIGNAIVTSGIPSTVGQASLGLAPDPSLSMVDAINSLAFPASGPAIPVSPISLKLAGCTLGVTAAATVCTGGLWPSNPTNNKGYISTFPNVNISDNGLGKLDYHLNDKNTLNGSFLGDAYKGDGMDHPFVNAIFKDTNLIRVYTVSSDWVYAANSKLVNDARFGFDKMTYGFVTDDGTILPNGSGGLCTSTGCGSGYPVNTGVTTFGGLPNINLKHFEKLGSWHNRPQNFANQYYDIQDSVSYLTGKHSFKFGVEFANIDLTNAIYDTGRGLVQFNGGQTPGISGSSALQDLFSGYPAAGQLLAGSANREEKWQSYAGFAQDDWRLSPKLTLNLGLRYSYVSPMQEVNGLWGNFSPAQGLVQQGVGNTLYPSDFKDLSPRAGFAWDVTGKGTTVVRGGFSVMYSAFSAVALLNENSFQNTTAVTIAAVPTGATLHVGTCQATNNCGTPGGTINLSSAALNAGSLNWDPTIHGASLNNGKVFPSSATTLCGDGASYTVGGTTYNNASPCNILAIDPNLTTPYVVNWNLGVQHSIGNNLSLEVGYVGNIGQRLTGFRDVNQVNLQTGVKPFATQFPYLNFINQESNDAHSSFNSLQVTLTKRVSHGLSFIAGYTYGHGLDNNSLNRSSYLPQNSANPAAEYGSSDFDVRHRFTFTTTYSIPGIKGYGQLLEGWKLNGIITVQSAQPWQANDFSNGFVIGHPKNTADSSERWNISGNPSNIKDSANSTPYCTGPGACSITSGISATTTALSSTVSNAMWQECQNAAADPTGTLTSFGCYVSNNMQTVITPPANGTFGNMGRNIFRDAAFSNVDFSVFKNFTFRERYSAQFRVEFFNLFNRPDIANPYGSSNGYGVGNDLSTGPQFGCGCATSDVAAGSPQISSGAARSMQLGLKLTF